MLIEQIIEFEWRGMGSMAVYTGCFKSHARFYTVKKSMDILL